MGRPCKAAEVHSKARIVCQPLGAYTRAMELVPAFIAPLVLSNFALEQVGPAVVLVGRRYEIDLAAVNRILGATASLRLRQYWSSCQEFWASSPTGDYVTIQRDLVNVKQADPGHGRPRIDLKNELEALEQTPGLKTVVKALLGVKVDRKTLNRICDSVVVDGDATTISYITTDRVYWDAALGGAASPGEVRRYVSITARHAPWRDCQVRRLCKLEVTAEEVWPAAKVGT